MKTSFQTNISDPHSLNFLPWQLFCLFSILGLFFYRCPVASGLALILLLIFLYHQKTFQTTIYICFFLFFVGWGLAWFYLSGADNTKIPLWMENQEEVYLSGTIQRVTPKPNHRLQIIVTDNKYRTKDGQSGVLKGKLVWKWQDPIQWPSPGQRISGQVKIKPVWGSLNPGCWDTVFYWHRQGVNYKVFSKHDKDQIEVKGKVAGLWKLRLHLRESILSHTKPGPGQGLLLALIMGDRSLLSYPVLDLVRRASLAHSLALSGLHLGFLVTIAWVLAWGIGFLRPSIYLLLPRQKIVVLISIPFILVYLWLGQARPSLVRASLMFFFWGWLFLHGRQKFLLDGLFFALVVILIISPLAIYDLGLQLSLIAVTGIICFCPILFRAYWNSFQHARWSPWLFPVFALFTVSLIANIVLLPITVWNFAQWNYHLYLNVLWLPVLGWVVLPFGLLGGIISLCPCLDLVSGLLLSTATWILEFFVNCLSYLSQHGALEALYPLRPSWLECFGYWFLLILAFLYWSRIRFLPCWSLFLAMALLFAPGVYQEVKVADQEISLNLIDVGQGQSVLLDLPGGKRVLIDGGGSWNREFDLGRYILSPYLTWGREPDIELVVLTHPDFDHMRGLYFILDHYRVGRFVFNGHWPEGWDKQNLQRILTERSLPVHIWQAGDVIDLGHGLKLEVVHPPQKYDPNKDNDASLVLRLSYQDQGLAILPGDIEKSGIQKCLKTQVNLEADILVLPHHGSSSSLSPQFYQQVDPQLALASCKRLNYFRFPHSSVDKALTHLGIPLKTTARKGFIRVKWEIPSLKMEVVTMR